MKYDFHVHDVIRVEYRVITDGSSFPRGYAQIEREERVIGGNGVLAAYALAKWGATVLLTGNAIGEDSHGRFLVSELSGIRNLTYEPEIDAQELTPYAILLKAGTHNIGALLSPNAARVSMRKRPQNPALAGFFFGDRASFGEPGAPAILRAPSQDYEALIHSLEAVAVCYLSLLEEGVSPAEKAAFVSYVVEKYQESFSGVDSIPGLEEIESSLRQER
jgi:hypothetical protein